MSFRASLAVEVAYAILASHQEAHVTLPVLPPRYEPRSLLGRGGMSAVYLVYDRELKREVALKLVRESASFSLHAEIRAVAQLSHPNIVQLFDVGQTEDAAYFTMEYIQGGTFSSIVKSPPSWPSLFSLLQQILGALAYTHAKGVLHRDLKPENLLLQREQVFVADLGLAIHTNEVELSPGSSFIAGTPLYMAPEQFSSDTRDLGPWTDLYAMGVLLFYLVSAQKPFQGTSAQGIFVQKAQGAPRLTVRDGYQAPPELLPIIERLLSPEPQARFLLAADLLSALRGCTPPKEETTTQKEISIFEALTESPTQQDAPHTDTAPTSSLALFSLRDPGVIGREEPQQILQRAAKEAFASKSPRLVLLEGEAGAGKSRLLQDLKETVEQRGEARLFLCQEEGTYLGLVGAAHRMLRSYSLPRRATLSRLMRFFSQSAPSPTTKALASWLAPEPGDAPLSLPEQDVLFLHLLSYESRRGGVVVGWEGLSQEGLARLLRLLIVGRRAALPLLLVVTVRSEVWRSLELTYRRELLTQPGATMISLPRLEEEALRRLILARAPIEESLLSSVCERSEGNPLYALTLLQYWIQSELLEASEGGYRLIQNATQEALPPSLEEVFLARIQAALQRAPQRRLAQNALSIASLLGVEPSRETLLRALSRAFGDESSEEGLRFLRGEGFLQKTERPGILRFEHGLLRSFWVARVEAEEGAASLHRACAIALQEEGDAASCDAAAYHWERAREPALAARCALSAAKLWFSLDLTQAQRAAAYAKSLAEDLPEEEALLAAARVEKANADWRRGELKEAETELRLALLCSTLEHSFKSKALVELSWILVRQQRFIEGEQLAQEAWRLAEARNDPDGLSSAALSLGHINFRQGNFALAEQWLLRSLMHSQENSTEHGHAVGGNQVHALRWLASLTAEQGALKESKKYIEEAIALAEAQGSSLLKAILTNERAELYRSQNDLPEAKEAYQQAGEAFLQLGDTHGQLLTAVNLTIVELLLGDLISARSHWERALSLLPVGPHQLRCALALKGAWLCALEGKNEEARSFFKESMELGIEKEIDTDTALAAEHTADALGTNVKEMYLLALRTFQSLARPLDEARIAAKLQQSEAVL